MSVVVVARDRLALSRAVRYVLAAVALVAAGYMALHSFTIRSWEVDATGWLITTFMGMEAVQAPMQPDVLYFRWNPGGFDWAGIRITAACTGAVFLAPLAGIVGILLWARRMNAIRVIIAGVLTASLMIVANLIRLVGIVAAYAYGGVNAFEWAHVFGGSIATIVGSALGIYMFTRIVLSS